MQRTLYLIHENNLSPTNINKLSKDHGYLYGENQFIVQILATGRQRSWPPSCLIFLTSLATVEIDSWYNYSIRDVSQDEYHPILYILPADFRSRRRSLWTITVPYLMTLYITTRVTGCSPSRTIASLRMHKATYPLPVYRLLGSDCSILYRLILLFFFIVRWAARCAIVECSSSVGRRSDCPYNCCCQWR